VTNADRLKEFFKKANEVMEQHDGCYDGECSEGKELATLITELKRDLSKALEGKPV